MRVKKTITKICLYCNEEFTRPAWWAKKIRYCSLACSSRHREELGLNNTGFSKGHVPANKGKTLEESYDPETVKRLRDALIKANTGRPSGNKGRKHPYKPRPSARKEKVIKKCPNPTNNENCGGIIKSRGSLCQSCALIGHIPWNKGLTKKDAPSLAVPQERRDRISAGGMGRKVSNETKRKIARNNRESMKRKMAAGGTPMVPAIGIYEPGFLDKMESLLGYKIERQHPVIGYWLDGYCRELNLAIEIDEKHHLKQAEYDKKREDDIKNELGCRFLRIPLYKNAI